MADICHMKTVVTVKVQVNMFRPYTPNIEAFIKNELNKAVIEIEKTIRVLGCGGEPE